MRWKQINYDLIAVCPKVAWREIKMDLTFTNSSDEEMVLDWEALRSPQETQVWWISLLPHSEVKLSLIGYGGWENEQISKDSGFWLGNVSGALYWDLKYCRDIWNKEQRRRFFRLIKYLWGILIMWETWVYSGSSISGSGQGHSSRQIYGPSSPKGNLQEASHSADCFQRISHLGNCLLAN